MKTNQSWCMSYIFLPRTKGQISLKFNNYCQFERFLYTTLNVLSQIKDIKHIEWDFQSVTWVMPLGRGCWGGSKHYFYEQGHVAYQIEGDDEFNRIQVILHPRIIELVTFGWVKRSYIKLQSQSH